MTMEIIVGLIGIVFTVLAVFFILTLYRVRRAAKKADHVLSLVHHILRSTAEPTIELVDNANKLSLDLKKKLDALDMLFHPLYALKKEEHKGCEKICDLLGYISEGIHLFSKIKKEMKR